MPQLKGEHHHSAKLTTEDVRDIRASYIPGAVTMAALASQYGVSKTTVSQIIAGKGWQHIDD